MSSIVEWRQEKELMISLLFTLALPFPHNQQDLTYVILIPNCAELCNVVEVTKKQFSKKKYRKAITSNLRKAF